MSGFSVMSKEPSIIWAADRLINKRIDSNYYHIKYIEYLDTIVNCGLDCKPFEDICKRMNSGPFGSALLASAYVEKGVPFIRPLNCKNFIVEDNELVFISNEDSIRLKSSRFNSGALIITKIGNGIGDVAIIPRKNDKCNISGNLMGVEIKNSYDNYFVLSFLKSKYGQNQIWQGMMNSAKPKIDMDTIRSIQIPIPSAEIQKYIGDKVRRAEELREEAKAAKKDYEYIIQDIYSDSNIIKFPKGFYTVQSHDFDDKHLRIDSNFYNPLYKNGKLNSYKNVKLSKLVDLKKNCKIQAEEEYAYFEIGDLSTSNILDGKERVKGSELPGRAKLKLEKDDIIVSLVQESIEVTSYVDKELNNTLTTNGCAVLIPRDKSLSGYLYAIISSKYFIAQKCRYISGTNIRSMSKDDLLDMKIPIVEDEIITKVNGLVLKEFTCLRESKQLILEAKQDVEDLIEGKFDMSKLNNESSTESRC
ncbi:MAG: restriction modification system specificity domain protein [Clostridia bacterium]|nr:restriction modification system specificity domain protein [Clostridia bacterium]